MQKNLSYYTNDILNYIQEIPLSKNTIKYYCSCYKSLGDFCENNGNNLSTQMIEKFLKYQKLRYDKKEISKVYYLNLKKATYSLIEYIETGTIKWERRNYNQKKLCKNFSNILIEYENYLITTSIATSSIKLLIQLITRFLIFLENEKIYEISKIELANVKKFIIEVAPKQKANMLNVTWPMKKFFIFLNTKKYSTINVQGILANPVPQRKKVLPCFTKEELTSIFSNIDISTTLGKRDYAILKLAVGTGLRIIDIVNLCFSNIDWKRNEIQITQHKTCKQLALPLSADVGNAIADYILNGRPKSKSKYIFLKNKRPYEKLNRIVGANTINRCLSKTKIVHNAGDGKTFHSLRRTFGTELVKANVPITMVSQLLGHNTLDTSRHYIALNDNMLQMCCLDISKYATTKEALL